MLQIETYMVGKIHYKQDNNKHMKAKKQRNQKQGQF